MKSVKPKRSRDEPPADGGWRNRQTDFRRQSRSNETHACFPGSPQSRRQRARESRTRRPWRIVMADAWGRDHLDCVSRRRSRSPTTVTANSLSAFSKPVSTSNAVAVVGRLRLDQTDEVSGNDFAKPADDRSIELEFAYRSGGEAILKAKREISSNPTRQLAIPRLSTPRIHRSERQLKSSIATTPR